MTEKKKRVVDHARDLWLKVPSEKRKALIDASTDALSSVAGDLLSFMVKATAAVKDEREEITVTPVEDDK